MALSAILGSLAVLSVVLLLWQWIAGLRFPLHRRNPEQTFSPAVTLLKPLKGCDASTEECLRSWFTQNYPGSVQILFGVAADDDPVGEIVRKLIGEYPAANARLMVCGPLAGANAKVSKLLQLEQSAKHEILVISDADVRVPGDLLENVVAAFQGHPVDGSPSALGVRDSSEYDLLSPALSSEGGEGEKPEEASGKLFSSTAVPLPRRRVGLVNCFYSLANPTTLAMQWEAIAINADFWTQVLQAQSLKPLDFALGAVMVTTRQSLQKAGGFAALVNCLADDYQLGNRIARGGESIVLSTVPVECFSAAMGWRAVWKHQMRWARTIRVSQPAPYFFSILSNAMLWPLLWLAMRPGLAPAIFGGAALVMRVVMAVTAQTRLSQRRTHLRYWWLTPVKDLLQVAIWAGAFLGNTIEWRGQRMKLRRDGQIKLET